MKRNGFTMVELIFVIIIIGILSVAAIPKFGDIKDRAKINAEYSSLSGLDGAIIAATEFYADDNNGDIGVAWHGETEGTATITVIANANANKSVLSKIVKKGDDLKITKYISLDKDGALADAQTVSEMEYNVIFLEGKASGSSIGVKESDETNNLNGKPDKNDFWVFNTSPVSVTISHWDGDSNEETIVESGELILIDSLDTFSAMGTAGADTTDDGEVSAELSDGTGLTIAG